MGILTSGIYMAITGIGVLGVFFLLPKWRRKEILRYIESLDK